MTNGGYIRAEAWNLQLQGAVDKLKAELDEAEKHLRAVLAKPDHSTVVFAQRFLKQLDVKRQRAKEQMADIEALLASDKV